MKEQKIIAEKTIKQLNSVGLKATSARLLILRTFSEKCHPLCAEEVYKKLKRDLDLVTVHRSLTTFEKVGIIQKVDLRQNSQYYELKNHHHHLVCKTCGIIEEFDICDIDKLSSKVLHESKNFSEINQHLFELFGTCKKCVKAGA